MNEITNSASGKKIIMVGSLPPPYHGSSVYFQGLLNSELKERYELHHVDISDHRGLENLSRLDITNVVRALRGIADLRKTAIGISPDIVYIPVASNILPFLRDGLLMITAARYSDAKIVIHLHEGSYFRDEFYAKSGKAVRKFIEKALSHVDTAIVYSPNLRRVFEGLVGNVVSFFNGAEPCEAPPETYGRQGANVLFASNLFESKGILAFLKSAVLIAREHPEAVFKVAGAWGADKEFVRSESEKIMKEGGITGKVKFLGTLGSEDLGKEFDDSDVFIFPTKYPYEGCPMILIEAMNHAVPSVTSLGIGAIPEMITHGKEGYLADPDDHAAIAEYALKLLKSKELRRNMGAEARARFESAFTRDINIKNIAKVFDDALAEKEKKSSV